jgi:CRISPR/Cas system-associated exonuclease Cas4 (RecB family)
MVSVEAIPAGWASIDAIACCVERSKGGDALAPATVVCASHTLAVGLRRSLVSHCGRTNRRGIGGLTVTTVNRLAEQLAQPVLLGNGGHVAGRIELLAAIRETLRRQPGMFGSVADHRTTEDRLVAFFQEITGLPSELRAELEASSQGLAQDAFRVAREASGLMEEAYGEDRLIELALDQLDQTADFALGPLILFNPEPVRPYEGRLVQAMARRPDASVVVSTTGYGRIDERYLRRLAAWSIQIDLLDEPGESGPREPSRDALVVEVAAPDEEVRAAVREVAAHAASGVSLSDMAILYSTADPYASMLTEQLEAAGLPFTGPGYRPLIASLAGRTLRRLLSLAAHGLDRGSVIGLLNSAPIDRGNGSEAPALLWDRLSRQAGVIDGEHWESRLAELAASVEDDEPTNASTAELSAFVTALRDRLRPPSDPTWRSWSTWALDLLDHYFISGDKPQSPVTWPHGEITAHELVRDILNRVGRLDSFGGPPRLDTFEATVLSELDGLVVPGIGQGHGLLVAPIALAAGLPFERIGVVGAVEGRYPRVAREDSLLPDQQRAGAKGLLIEKGLVTELDVHQAALVAASAKAAATFYTARGDLRSNRSRSWPEVLRPLARGESSVVASHYQGLVDHGRPASIEDFALRALVTHADGGDPIHTHVLAGRDAVLAAGLRRGLNRGRMELTEHTGRVRRGMIDPVEQLFSPTALETYALCPRKYLFQRVLRLRDEERPERIAEITAREKGNLVHRVLERFLSAALDQDEIPEPDQPWSPEQRGHLLDILDEEIKLDQARGITGGEVRTRLLRQWLVAEMHRFLDRDNLIRAQRQSTPQAAEFSFGFEDSPALEGLWAGRHLRLRGKVDRVDVTADGGLMVIDYKGGSGRQFQQLDSNPLDDGRRLQLPLYARAVADRFGRDGPQVGLYWLTTKDEIREVVLNDDLESDLEAAVGAALDGIVEGLFPGVPGSAISWPRITFENCRYCDFERICPTDRQSEWERVKTDPELKPIQVVIKTSGDGR